LASTDVCRNQAFSPGANVLGHQFHAEPRVDRFERWLVGQACELSVTRVDPRELRAKAEASTVALEESAAVLMYEWLERLS